MIERQMEREMWVAVGIGGVGMGERGVGWGSMGLGLILS